LYRTIDAAFWTDPKVKQLPPDGKLLLLYFITNPHTHVSGIYVLPGVMVQHETGLTKPKLDTLCNTLSSLGFCQFDTALEVIWVRKMMSYQGRGEKNLRSAAAHIAEDLHNSFLCKEFLALYPQVKEYVKQAFIDTLSGRVSEVNTPNLRILNTDQDQDQDHIPRKRGPKTPAPKRIEIDPDMAEFAIGLGVNDVAGETEAMLDHFRGQGVMRVDWMATWRNWMRNNQKFRRNGNGQRKSKTDINRENAEKLLSRFDFEDSGRGVGGVI